MGAEQIDLLELLSADGAAESTHKAIWYRVRRQAAETVAELGPKEVAGAFDMDKSGLLHALAERNRARLSAEQLVYLQVASKHDALSAIVPQLRGMELVPAKPLTAEEKLARWESLADRMGDHGKWMRDQVYGKRR